MNFENLPKSEHKKVISLFKAGKYNSLKLLLKRHNVSDCSMACNKAALRRWINYGISMGLLNAK